MHCLCVSASLITALYYRLSCCVSCCVSRFVSRCVLLCVLLCVLQCIYRIDHEGWDFLLHGLFCFAVFSNLTYTGSMHFYGEPLAASRQQLSQQFD